MVCFFICDSVNFLGLYKYRLCAFLLIKWNKKNSKINSIIILGERLKEVKLIKNGIIIVNNTNIKSTFKAGLVRLFWFLLIKIESIYWIRLIIFELIILYKLVLIRPDEVEKQTNNIEDRWKDVPKYVITSGKSTDDESV